MGGKRKSRLIADVLAGLVKQETESAEEFQRRRNRERRRAYRALKPKEPRRLRGPDKQLRKNAAPAHVREALTALPGESEEDRNRRYRKLVMQEWRKKNREKELSRRRELEKTPGYKAKKTAWIERNHEKAAEYQKRHFEKNRETKLVALEAWRAKNPERVKQVQKEWFAKHPGYLTVRASRYRELAVQATPPWMWSQFGKDVERIYRQCARVSEKTGIPHHVDHIYPLAGKNSSGLHVPWNLQILPAAMNGRKHNKSPEEFSDPRPPLRSSP